MPIRCFLLLVLSIGAWLNANPVIADTYLFVARQDLDDLIVVDTDSDQIISTISNLCDGPAGIVASMDGLSAYCGCANQLAVVVIDIAKAISDPANALVDTIDLSDHMNPGEGFWVSPMAPDGSAFAVTSYFGNTVLIVGTDGVLKAAIPVVDGPREPTFSLDSEFLYVPCLLSGTVAVLRLADNAVVRDIPTGVGTGFIMAEPSGDRLYVSNSGWVTTDPGDIAVIDTEIANDPDNPLDPVIDVIPVGGTSSAHPNRVNLSSDGSFLYAHLLGTPSEAESLSAVSVVDISTLSELQEITLNARRVANGTFTLDKRFLFCGGKTNHFPPFDPLMDILDTYIANDPDCPRNPIIKTLDLTDAAGGPGSDIQVSPRGFITPEGDKAYFVMQRGLAGHPSKVISIDTFVATDSLDSTDPILNVLDCGTRVVSPQIITLVCEPKVFTQPDGVCAYRDCQVQSSVEIEGVCDLGAFQFDCLFDESLLEYAGITLGPFPTSTGREVLELGPIVGAGRISYGAFSFGEEAGPYGEGCLATLLFNRIGPGSGDAELSLENVQVTDTDGLTQPTTTAGSVLHLVSYIFGDFDEDCVVTVVDIMEIADHWGEDQETPGYDPRFDVDLLVPGDFCASMPNGTIDVVDIQLVASQWNSTCDGPPARPSIPRSQEVPLTLSLEPHVVTGDDGELVDIEIVASGADNLGAFQVVLSTTPGSVAIENVSIGDFLGSTGNAAYLLEDASGPGQHAVGAFSFGTAEGPSGEGTLAHITLRILDCGLESDLTLLTPRAVTAGGCEVSEITVVGAITRCPATSLDDISTGSTPISALTAAPNPFVNSTSIEFTVSEPGHVRIEVHDILGRRVRAITGRTLDAGPQTIDWNGRNDTGEQVSAGVYFVELRTVAGVQRLKLLLLR